MVDENDVMSLFDDIAAFLDIAPAEAQDSSDSPTTHFLTTKVEETRSMVAKLLKSSVRSTVDSGLIDKVNEAIAVLSANDRMPILIAEFL